MSRLAAATLALAAVLATAAAPARADVADGFRGGFTAGYLLLSEPEGGDIVLRQPAGDAPTFEVALTYRYKAIEAGALVGHVGSGSFAARRGGRERLGGQAYAGALLRWHYSRAEWGSSFITVVPAWMGFEHTDHVRLEIGEIFEEDPRTVDTNTDGFALGLDTGLAFDFTRRLSGVVGLRVSIGITELAAGDRDLPYALTSLALYLGINAGL